MASLTESGQGGGEDIVAGGAKLSSHFSPAPTAVETTVDQEEKGQIRRLLKPKRTAGKSTLRGEKQSRIVSRSLLSGYLMCEADGNDLNRHHPLGSGCVDRRLGTDKSAA